MQGKGGGFGVHCDGFAFFVEASALAKELVETGEKGRPAQSLGEGGVRRLWAMAASHRQ